MGSPNPLSCLLPLPPLLPLPRPPRPSPPPSSQLFFTHSLSLRGLGGPRSQHRGDHVEQVREEERHRLPQAQGSVEERGAQGEDRDRVGRDVPGEGPPVLDGDARGGMGNGRRRRRRRRRRREESFSSSSSLPSFLDLDLLLLLRPLLLSLAGTPTSLLLANHPIAARPQQSVASEEPSATATPIPRSSATIAFASLRIAARSAGVSGGAGVPSS